MTLKYFFLTVTFLILTGCEEEKLTPRDQLPIIEPKGAFTCVDIEKDNFYDGYCYFEYVFDSPADHRKTIKLMIVRTYDEEFWRIFASQSGGNKHPASAFWALGDEIEKPMKCYTTKDECTASESQTSAKFYERIEMSDILYLDLFPKSKSIRSRFRIKLKQTKKFIKFFDDYISERAPNMTKEDYVKKLTDIEVQKIIDQRNK